MAGESDRRRRARQRAARGPARTGARARRARRRRRVRPGAYRATAESRLKRFRQSTLLTVAVTGVALMVWGLPAAEGQGVQDTAAAPQDTAAGAGDTVRGVQGAADTAVAEVGRAVAEATSTLRQLAFEFAGALPKVGIALLIFALAWLAARAAQPVARRLLRGWQRAQGAGVLMALLIWVFAAAVAVSVIAGDVRALVGSFGLLGLALSWALQAPIESFTAYLLNSFKGYYRVGDRIAVGDVFGDVYKIDLLTTTVWEAGGPDKAVQGAQPTGALTTFPNSEVLRGNVINYTGDFPYIWDEVVVGVANESDLRHAMKVVEDTAREIVGVAMREPAARYRALLERAGLAFDVAEEPQVYMAPQDAWVNITVRYLVDARARRTWASRLHLAISEAFARPENEDRIVGSYPVTRVDLYTPEAEA